MQPQSPHLYPVPDRDSQPFDNGESLNLQLDKDQADLTRQLTYEAINAYDTINTPAVNQPPRADEYGQGVIEAAITDYRLPANPPVSEKSKEKQSANSDLELIGINLKALRDELQKAA